MYACGLVLWELASRCTINHMQQNLDQTKISNPSPAIEEYKLPYEAEISNNPTIDQMLKLGKYMFSNEMPQSTIFWSLAF